MHHRRTLKRIEEPGHARYLTCSCYHRLPLFANDLIKQAFVEQLRRVRERLSFELYAWVVMPEHFHLLILPDPPRVTVTNVLRALKQPLAHRVLQRWRELDAAVLGRVTDVCGRAHFWQVGGGYDRNIVTPHEAREKVVYVHENPQRRDLVVRATDWPWSSAAWYEGGAYRGPPIDPWPL